MKLKKKMYWSNDQTKQVYDSLFSGDLSYLKPFFEDRNFSPHRLKAFALQEINHDLLNSRFIDLVIAMLQFVNWQEVSLVLSQRANSLRLLS